MVQMCDAFILKRTAVSVARMRRSNTENVKQSLQSHSNNQVLI